MELTPKGQGKINKRTRRCWTTREEQVLIAALKDIVSKGWKCDNGFRAGYLKVLTGSMKKVFPGTDIRAEPHINSKLHVWKTHYASLASMLNVSGITWNDSTKMIDAQDDAWNSYVKTDSHALTMRYKSWQFYPDWCQIFGKGSVIMEDTDHIADVVLELEADKAKEKEAVAKFGCVFEGDEDENEMSVCQPQSDGTGTKQAPNKRKMSACSSDPSAAAVNVSPNKQDARFEGVIARRSVGFEYDGVTNARRGLYGELGRIPGLQVREKLTVAKFLVNKTGDLELFFSLPDEAKVEMVNMILAGEY
ncbi:hypothetical protein SASPL_120811 [Salvia splendens]|uniref:Myb/SANT-like domain-containing protein n=1 Tax=Salvia splendens TaxID=180675 RepID=A0A8X8ZU94_SALSN|nr:uncharacterized protein LOC121742548 [Salvia splendens]XP_041991644.1 uncharacterized protein LOC121742548 [Salvia splendens]KAG6418607.1 hypothetical protein SASPL_120811 [Salvia splendens]